MADSRADCLHGLMTLIERFLPRAILVENVTGFVRGASSALPFIEKGLAGVNNRSGTRYKLFYRVLNAVDFGIPQRRRRAFVIALRDGGEPVWPRVTHRDCPERAWDALQSVRLKTPPVSTGRFAALLPSIPEGQNYQYFTERGDGPALFGYRRRYWSFLLKLAKAEPAWTVPASPGPATGPFHWDSRPLAPEEILRLQAFPRAWELEGSHRERVRQAGNATPPASDRDTWSIDFHAGLWNGLSWPASDACNRTFCPRPSTHASSTGRRRVHCAFGPARPSPWCRARTESAT